MLQDVTTCPLELLLFFHNVPWTHPIQPAGTSKATPLFDYIRDGHAAAVMGAKQLAADWRSLEGLIDTKRFEGVAGRFRQQIHDAGVFANLIVGYYANISGMPGMAAVQAFV